jgi:hypothetical protein
LSGEKPIVIVAKKVRHLVAKKVYYYSKTDLVKDINGDYTQRILTGDLAGDLVGDVGAKILILQKDRPQ